MSNKTALVPKLRFPEFRDSEEWRQSTLGKIFTRIAQGGTPDTSNPKFWNGTIDWLTPAEMGKSLNPFIQNTNRKITDLGLKNCSSILLPVNSIIISTRAPIGYLGINTVPMAINQGCKALMPNPHLHSLFLYYFLHANENRLNDLGAGNTFKELSTNALKSFCVYFPSNQEQQKIADCLSSLDDLITAEDKKLSALKVHKKGLIQKLFPAQGKTVPEWRFPEFRDCGEWVIYPLVEICQNFDRNRIPIAEKERKKGSTPYYGASGIVDYIDGFIFDEELLCVSEDGANLVARTYPIAFSISGKTWVNNHAHVLKFENSFTQVLVESYLNSISLSDFLTGMAQPKLNRAKLDIIPIPLPEEKERQKIADCLSSLDALISAQTEKIEALKIHKRGLMQGIFPSFEEVGE